MSAERFLRGFASSARAHYGEQILRLVIGMAIVVASPEMWHATLFEIFGWTIVVTAVGLILLPWRWHRAFGEWAIPMAIRHIKLYGFAALILGAAILYGASRFVLK